MAIVITDSKYYTNIAAAIRGQNGEETKYKPPEMAAAIQAIIGSKLISEMNIFENIGTFTITYNDGKIATGSVVFDENGLPANLTYNGKNIVNFTDGYPTGATDNYEHTVPVVWD